MIDSTPAGSVAVLLCTYNGQRFLEEQLNSLAAQSCTNWNVWISDDGSSDDTLSILAEYQKKWRALHRLTVQEGPRQGFAANFLSLTCNLAIEATYYAYSDQDDIWEADKLERAIEYLATVPSHVPALYCSRTRIVDALNRETGLSPLFVKAPSFANALTQNVGSGNTMVFNNAMISLLRKAGSNLPVVAHDWWAYLVVTGCGGEVFYDKTPSLRYRQHDNNLVGEASGWPARIRRARKYWKGDFRRWCDGNIDGLNRIRELLTEENRATLDQFATARHQGPFKRIVALRRAQIYRQTMLGTLGLIGAAFLGKI